MEAIENLRKRLVEGGPGYLTLAALFYLLMLVIVPSSPLLGPLIAFFILAARAVAALTSGAAVQTIKLPDERKSWRYLYISLTLWVSADAIESVSWVVRGTPIPTPSVGDLLRFAGCLAALTFFTGYPVSPPERFGRFRDLLDQIILGLAVLALSWLIFISPILDIGMGNTVQIFWSTIFPVFDSVILVLLLRLILLATNNQVRRSFLSLGFAFLIIAVCDLADGYRILQGGVVEPGLIEAGWLVSNTFLTLASFLVIRVSISNEENERRRGRQRIATRLEPLLPIAFTYAVVGITAFDWWLSGEVDWIAIGASVILSLLLVGRQGIIAGHFEMRQYATMINSSADFAFICQENGIILFTNPSLKQILEPGDGLDDLRFDGFAIIEEGETDIFHQALDGGWTGEISFRRQNGSLFPVLLSLMPVEDARGSSKLLAGTAHDLTTIRERENELRGALGEVAAARADLEALNIELEGKVQARTSELESTVAELEDLLEELKGLDRMKTEFVALVSHELRAPLTNIRSGIELILHKEKAVNASVREALHLVQAETQRLSRFVETILDLSSLEAGRFPVELTELAVEVIAMKVNNWFMETGYSERLNLQFPQDLPAAIADEHALESVFFHLIDNALKYAPQGEIVVEGWAEAEKVFVAVSDSGPGIHPDERERIFEMFHRGDTSDSREVYGYGLGLPMVQRLVEIMNGGIHIEESPSGGARLVFWLPEAG
ncbi:MAG: PAS domain-containing sensor histidine kinase [Anaerolineaceae bacterium]|nr:MAG: PAS domain-containing sensor histidine kinase [Anaerolineaceae bacterium]